MHLSLPTSNLMGIPGKIILKYNLPGLQRQDTKQSSEEGT